MTLPLLYHICHFRQRVKRPSVDLGISGTYNRPIHCNQRTLRHHFFSRVVTVVLILRDLQYLVLVNYKSIFRPPLSVYSKFLGPGLHEPIPKGPALEAVNDLLSTFERTMGS